MNDAEIIQRERDKYACSCDIAGELARDGRPMHMAVKPASPVHAPRGTSRTAKSWDAEAAKRMLMNNLDPAVAERPDELVVYGGTGKAARNWARFRRHRRDPRAARRGRDAAGAVGQAGRRCSDPRGRPAGPDRQLDPGAALGHAGEFRRLEGAGLTMYGQMTAGSWIYIGTQGILQGTYETLPSARDSTSAATLAGRLAADRRARRHGRRAAAGGDHERAASASPSRSTPARIQRRLETRYLDEWRPTLDDALRARTRRSEREARVSIGLVGNAADVSRSWSARRRSPTA